MPVVSNAVYQQNDVQNKYSPQMGFVYLFNLIVGTGALTLPAAFSRAGWALGSVFIVVLGFISFITMTFVIESMSLANAVLSRRHGEGRGSTDDSCTESRILESTASRRERDPLLPPPYDESLDFRSRINPPAVFDINHRVELGGMAAMFFGKIGLFLFYLCIVVYLYGDLAIYIAAVAKSLRDVSCVYVPQSNGTALLTNGTIPDTDPCWNDMDGMTRFQVYRLYSVIFLVVLGPFAFFNISKTKYLQLITSVLRWTAFLVMIGLACRRIIEGKGPASPAIAEISALPNLFGVCIYSFMCHHSLPSLVTPISSKKWIRTIFCADYVLITIFYLLLAVTGIFAFNKIQDLYTLNFQPQYGESPPPILNLVVQYFLSLFPVFTLSASFPIIAITLRNNLKALFHVVDEEDEYPNASVEDSDSEDERGTLGYPRTSPPLLSSPHRSAFRSSSPSAICCKILSKCGFPLLAIIPPFLISLLVEDVNFLVGITGSYAGAGIQYFIPLALVTEGRKRIQSRTNPFASPFRHEAWTWFVFAWAIISVSFVTVNRFIDITHNAA